MIRSCDYTRKRSYENWEYLYRLPWQNLNGRSKGANPMPANTLTTEPTFTTVGELSDEALDAIAMLLIANFENSQTPAPDLFSEIKKRPRFSRPKQNERRYRRP
jgi:hypothetical protein